MTGEKAAKMKRDDIMRVLSGADETARERGAELVERFPEWCTDLQFLASDECAVTYLPVITIMLVARSIRERSELDVLDIQWGTGSRGYAASSIAGHLIKFVTQVGIDLRTTSSQVMNGHPFTYKSRVTPEMSGKRFQAAYTRFFSAAERVEELSSTAAFEVLALIFHLRRGSSNAETEVLVALDDRRALNAVIGATNYFVAENSEAGKVGQAFAAALFDILFPSHQIRMGNNNDPSATIPGDVQVGRDGAFWLWIEVKQKAVVSSEIQAFVDRVKAIGGDRAMYFALGNAHYPQNVDMMQLHKRAVKDGIELTIYSAPEQALSDLLPKAAGSAGMQAEALANRMLNRLHQAQVSSALEHAWIDEMRRFESGTPEELPIVGRSAES